MNMSASETNLTCIKQIPCKQQIHEPKLIQHQQQHQCYNHPKQQMIFNKPEQQPMNYQMQSQQQIHTSSQQQQQQQQQSQYMNQQQPLNYTHQQPKICQNESIESMTVAFSQLDGKGNSDSSDSSENSEKRFGNSAPFSRDETNLLQV